MVPHSHFLGEKAQERENQDALPLPSVIVPLVVPFTRMVTPGRPVLSGAPVTLPLTCLCAKAVVAAKAKSRINKVHLKQCVVSRGLMPPEAKLLNWAGIRIFI